MIPATALHGLRNSCANNKVKSVVGYFNRYPTLKNRNNEDLMLAALSKPKMLTLKKLQELNCNFDSYTDKVVDIAISTNKKPVMEWLLKGASADLISTRWDVVKQSSLSNTIAFFLKEITTTDKADFNNVSLETRILLAENPSFYNSRSDVLLVTKSIGYTPEIVFVLISRNGEEYKNKQRVCSLCRCKKSRGKTLFSINVCEDCLLV